MTEVEKKLMAINRKKAFEPDSVLNLVFCDNSGYLHVAGPIAYIFDSSFREDYM